MNHTKVGKSSLIGENTITSGHVRTYAHNLIEMTFILKVT